MFFYEGLVFLFCLFLTIITGDNVKKDNVKEKHEEEYKPTIDRRFLDDLDDKEWHISHLKDSDFDIDGDCNEETFEDKAKKYRETLKNDAALVEFVSGDTLKVKKEDLAKGKCKRNITNIFKTIEKTTPMSKLNTTKIRQVKKSNHTSSEGEVKATTMSMKELKFEDESVTNNTNKRRSEYQFSSVEYYDGEVQDFDKSICPDAVDVITLELDQLRNYDVECEAILEWRSLE
ncbi:uncharacterized protein LOC124542903 [Vanessa cardui]|uniref:uncharacterized protein LOC124542903 n=1 Tax=Vanessa cardui TaxID=171605 RepID=UPI001F1479EC|nr:uncharacterized protein LOC124542903 [Vanessa cardui]